jgi:hypothetical protein
VSNPSSASASACTARKLTGKGLDGGEGLLSGAAYEGDGDGAGVLVGARLPDDLVGRAGRDLLVARGLGDDIETIGLGEDGGRKREDGGNGETHFDDRRRGVTKTRDWKGRECGVSDGQAKGVNICKRRDAAGTVDEVVVRQTRERAERKRWKRETTPSEAPSFKRFSAVPDQPLAQRCLLLRLGRNET